ncbi:unnamed protein product [Peronospora belbahrii]|uniref:Uncharacterized protein n=1 Tax=Peronospora belbahrii TaxID=622444 RepID=A0ABN8DAU6_9STRA|nr:unnamed protein product [Peronospora belbahrii]
MIGPRREGYEHTLTGYNLLSFEAPKLLRARVRALATAKLVSVYSAHHGRLTEVKDHTQEDVTVTQRYNGFTSFAGSHMT